MNKLYLDNSEKVRCGDETYSVKWDLNELYGNAQKLKRAEMDKVCQNAVKSRMTAFQMLDLYEKRNITA